MNLAEFARACDRMLAEHVPGYEVRDFSGRDVTAEMISKAPPKRTGGEPRPVRKVFWKSRPQQGAWAAVIECW
jgi:hypothetical protein